MPQPNAHGTHTLVNEVMLLFAGALVPQCEIGVSVQLSAFEAQTIIARTYAPARQRTPVCSDTISLCVILNAVWLTGIEWYASPTQISDRAQRGAALTYQTSAG